MQKVISYLKSHKLNTFLILIILYLFAKNNLPLYPLSYSSSRSYMPIAGGGEFGGVADMAMTKSMAPMMINEAAPVESDQRLVIKDTTLSLQVKDVASNITAIEQTAVSLGGFLVNSELSTPEGAAYGSITVRVPVDKLDRALTSFKQLAVKVVAENVTGRDVTDEYEDLDARLSTLTTTKAKFETIRDQASRITDLLEVQRELINLQTQIDNIKGRQLYLTQTAKLARVSISLATDDLALPYAPDKSWRPEVVFKTAVRSLIVNLRSLGSGLIWLTVYSPLLLIGYGSYRLIKKIQSRHHS